MDWTGGHGLVNWTGRLDWTGGLDWCTVWTGGHGLVDWTGGLDWWMVDWWTAWTGGLDWWTDTKIRFPTTRQGSLACGVVWEPCT